MKYIKLFFISIIAFSILLFGLSLLFPSTTIVSRAMNVAGSKQQLASRLWQLHQLAFQKNESNNVVTTAPDTLLTDAPFASHIRQGLAIYTLGNDSTAIQVFYKVQVPWYKPWKKFGLMLNETKYGPSLDSAINRIRDQEQTF